MGHPVPASVNPPGTHDGPTWLGHPPGLFLLFMVEMWERFSYYGMRALLVLYLVSPTTGMLKRPVDAPEGFNPGLGWNEDQAGTLYGLYTGLAYLTPLVGGIIADRLIGTHRSMLAGGLLIMLGHIALAVSGMGGLEHTSAGVSTFIGGLALIVIGTGHFKPSVSVMVGQLYHEHDPRRDGAFNIFYMGINLGAFLCAFVCGTLGEKVGWHWGFGSAAVGMALGLVTYSLGRPAFLSTVGLPPAGKGLAWVPGFLLIGIGLSLVVALLFHHGHFGTLDAQIKKFMSESPKLATTLGLVVAGLAIAAAGVFTMSMPREDRGPVASIFIFMFFNAFFWLAFEQAGSSMTLFTDRYTDTHVLGWEMPTSWFQSVNPFLIFTFAPLFAILWTKLGARNMNPSQPVKIALGLILLGVGFVVLVLGARTISVSGEAVSAKAAIWFILGAYFFHTMGELCLSPTGLSYVTKAAPKRFISLLMGIWFISSFLANYSGGLIAGKTEAIEKGEVVLPWTLGQGTGSTQADFFFLFVVTSFGAGVLILVLSPLLKKLMRDAND